MIAPPTKPQAGPEIEASIASLFEINQDDIRCRAMADKNDCDFLVEVNDFMFWVEYRQTASAGPVAGAVEKLKSYANRLDDQNVPLVVVPYMGRIGQDICRKGGMSWLDLSGNAKITAHRLRIWCEGQPNKFSRRGRPPNVFAPKSSRIARQLLLHCRQFQSQAELARSTGLDDGYVSKLVRRLLRENLAERNDHGAVRPRDPELLLDAWASAYEFSRHRILKGHVSARSGSELVERLADKMERHKLEYAATGLGAAWLFTHFATFRLGTFFLRSLPTQAFMKEIGYWDEAKGANTWFVIPSDEGVFHGSAEIDGIACVTEVQAYLDLMGHPERAKEAADELRKKTLRWKMDG